MENPLIKPLTLGKNVFPVNIIQGPLAGISCAPFRSLIWEYSKPAFSCTEMISCKTLLYQAACTSRFLNKDPAEGPVCFQLSGNNPRELAEATKRVSDFGADLIDLNCGCPVNKIRSRGAGSRLLSNSGLLYELISAMKANTSVPVSVKIRVDGHSSDSFNREIASMLGDAGADFLVVHGRHWTETYETACHYDQIQFFVEELKIPVIGNGDIACIQSLKNMFATGCAGVMLGRASVGQPWLIGKLIAELRGESFIVPSVSARGSLFLSHVRELAALLESEKFAVIQARKFVKYYARDLINKMELCREINSCESLEELQLVCQKYFV